MSIPSNGDSGILAEADQVGTSRLVEQARIAGLQGHTGSEEMSIASKTRLGLIIHAERVRMSSEAVIGVTAGENSCARGGSLGSRSSNGSLSLNI